MDSEFIMLIWNKFYKDDTDYAEMKDIETLLYTIHKYIIILSSNTYTPLQNKKELTAKYKILVDQYNSLLSKYETRINNNKKTLFD